MRIPGRLGLVLGHRVSGCLRDDSWRQGGALLRGFRRVRHSPVGNGSLASRFARRRGHVHPVGFAQEAGGVQTLPELLELMRQRLPWRLLIAGVAGVLAILIAAAEVSNWDLFLRFVYQVPYGESDPQFGKDIGFYLFSLPAYVVLKNWLLTLVLSFLVAGAVYWVHGDVEFNEQRRSISPTAIAHGSA